MLSPSVRRRPAIVGLLLAAACASGGAASSAGTSAAPAAQAVRHDRSTITSDELRASESSTLYDVVQRLHPEWLLARTGPGLSTAGMTSGNTEVQVFLDAQHAGGLEVLRQFAPTQASSLRYYSSSEAEAKWGTGYLNGVIQILTGVRR